LAHGSAEENILIMELIMELKEKGLKLIKQLSPNQGEK